MLTTQLELYLHHRLHRLVFFHHSCLIFLCYLILNDYILDDDNLV